MSARCQHNSLKRHGEALLLGILAAALVMVAAASRARGAGLLIAEGRFGGVLEMVDHDVRVTVNNGVAVTEVTQVFRNTENRQVEALYTFPVPRGASVSNFSMWIGGKEMVGEVLEKKRAREIYESYKQTRQDPGLLEQVDYKRFEMRIFPIGPNAEQKVRIRYYQELPTDHDRATWTYPLATRTVPNLDTKTTGRFSLTMQCKSMVPIVEDDCPSHGKDLVVSRPDKHHLVAGLEVAGGNLERDVVLSYRLERPATGVDLVTSRPKGEDGYFMLTLTAGKDLEKAAAAMDYVFVMDISGSMARDMKLATSTDQVAAFVKELGADDRFDIIRFNTNVGTLFNKLAPASPENLRAAAEHLDSIEARGGTVLEPALSVAYKYASPDRVLNVVVLSDGMTELGERQRLVRGIRNRPAGCRVFCIGVGNEVNRPVLAQLAEEAGGLAAFVSRGDNMERQAAAFRRKLQHPAVTNIELAFDGGEVYDVYPRTIPNLYHGAPLHVYGRYRKAGATELKLTGSINGKRATIGGTLDLPQRDDENPEIERMWALQKVDDINRRMPPGGDASLAGEIVRLGEAYSIVTQHTSFIVLENDAEYQRWSIERRNLLRLERDRSAHEARLANFDAVRKSALNGLGPEGVELVKSTSPDPASRQTTSNGQPNRSSSPQSRPSRRRSFNVPSGGGGGGAVGPVFVLAMLGLSGLGGLALRKKKHGR